MNNSKIPKLRFSEFKDTREWEEKRLGDVFKVMRGEVLSMNLVKDSCTKESPYPVYSSQTRNNGLAGFYTNYLYEDAITWTTDGAYAGDVNYRAGKFYCTNVCGVLLNNKGYANTCIAEIINTVSRKHVSYVGNPKLMNGIMSKIIISFPSLPEQEKIAACLSSADELISLHAEKLELLKRHKKGLMQQLFPAEGETVPKLRFSGFEDAGEWEEKRLGKICNINPAVNDLPNRFIYIDLKSVASGNLLFKKEIYKKDAPSRAQRLLKNGDVIYQMVRPYQRNNFLCDFIDENNYVASTGYAQLRPFYSSKFLFQIIHTDDFVAKVLSNVCGSNYPATKATDLADVSITLPSLPEQEKIAACLSSADELISLHAEKLESLKRHKKGLMQGLFPSYEEVQG